jgi:methylphosphotriester-DNA--protein-cysteine methyltransferase
MNKVVFAIIGAVLLGIILIFTLRGEPSEDRWAGCQYIAGKNSEIYHADPRCPIVSRIPPEDIICFNSSLEAQNAGYRPCKLCNREEWLIWIENKTSK